MRYTPRSPTYLITGGEAVVWCPRCGRHSIRTNVTDPGKWIEWHCKNCGSVRFTIPDDAIEVRDDAAA